MSPAPPSIASPIAIPALPDLSINSFVASLDTSFAVAPPVTLPAPPVTAISGISDANPFVTATAGRSPSRSAMFSYRSRPSAIAFLTSSLPPTRRLSSGAAPNVKLLSINVRRSRNLLTYSALSSPFLKASPPEAFMYACALLNNSSSAATSSTDIFFGSAASRALRFS